jgi:hypothetical protein
VVNLFIPGTATVKLAEDNAVTLEQVTGYPRTGEIAILVRPLKPSRFPIRLRIPAWSKTTILKVNGEERMAKAGTYLRLDRTWSVGWGQDHVEPRYAL